MAEPVMRGLGVLVKKELREQWRTLRLPSALGVFAFIGIASPAFARYLPEVVTALGGGQFRGLIPAPTVADSYAQLAKNAGQFGAALAVVLAMGSVSVERDRGTLAFLLSKPVSRTAVLAAKYAALGATMAVGVLVAGILAFAYTTLLFAVPGPGFVVFAVVTLIVLLVFVSLTVAASALTRSTLAAAGVGFGLLLLLGGLSIIPRVGDYTPSGTVAKAAQTVAAGTLQPLLGPLAVQVGLVVAGFLLALLALRRQEL